MTVTEVRIQIRWRDVDNYGHVNNAVYLTYLEEARDQWVRDVFGPEMNFVIARIAIDYRRELSLDDDEVIVTCQASGYGTSSIRTSERIVAKAGWVAAESESVIVAHDEASRSSRPLNDEERATLDRAMAST